MYLWKFKELAVALRENRISTKQYNIQKILFASFILFEAVVTKLQGMPVSQAIGVNLLKIIVLILITRIINQKGDNKDLGKRFVCFFPVSYVRALALALVVGAVVGLLGGIVQASFQTGSPEQWQTFASIISGIGGLVYITYIYITGFRIATGTKHYEPENNKA